LAHSCTSILDPVSQILQRVIELINFANLYTRGSEPILLRIQNNHLYLKLQLPCIEIDREQDATQINIESTLQEQDIENDWSNLATPSSSIHYTTPEVSVSAETPVHHSTHPIQPLESATSLDDYIDYWLEEAYRNWNEEDFWNLEYPLD
jgi:hypothetical protein